MRFSAQFAISELSDEDDWFDIELTTDTPLYVDPLLVFDDDDPTWSSTRTTVLEYFALAMEYVRLADGDRRSKALAKAERMLTFPEPREFALGVTLGSPEGSGTGPRLGARNWRHPSTCCINAGSRQSATLNSLHYSAMA